MTEIKVINLPYKKKHLEPFIREETVDLHYEKHHKQYFYNLAKLVDDNTLKEMMEGNINIDDIKDKKIYNNASQVLNHNDYWLSISPERDFLFRDKIEKMFPNLSDKIEEKCQQLFGSGYVWLVFREGKLIIEGTINANRPSGKILLSVDLWEHSYYLDYQYRRNDYISAFLYNLINWNRLYHLLEGLNINTLQ